MKKYIKYLKGRVNESLCYYYKIYGIFNQTFLCDEIIVNINKAPTPRLIRKQWDGWNNFFNFETITEEEWENMYEKLYNTIRDSIKNLGTYFKFLGRYVRIKEIKGETITADIIQNLGGKTVMFHTIGNISDFSGLSLEKITEEEWNKKYEKTK